MERARAFFVGDGTMAVLMDKRFPLGCTLHSADNRGPQETDGATHIMTGDGLCARGYVPSP